MALKSPECVYHRNTISGLVEENLNTISGFLVGGIVVIIILLLASLPIVIIPNVVFAQGSPWSLFQQLCPTGLLAKRPRQNLQIQQQQQQQQLNPQLTPNQSSPPNIFYHPPLILH